MKKSHSTTNPIIDKNRHLEEDAATLGQMTDLAKTITIPHQVNPHFHFSFIEIIFI